MTVMTGLGLISTLIMLGMCFYYSSKPWLALGVSILTAIFSLSFSYVLRRKALSIEVASGKLFRIYGAARTRRHYKWPAPNRAFNVG